MKTGWALEPDLHLGMLVHGVVADAPMQLSFRECFPVNLAQKLQKLFMLLPLKTTDNPSSAAWIAPATGD